VSSREQAAIGTERELTNYVTCTTWCATIMLAVHSGMGDDACHSITEVPRFGINANPITESPMLASIGPALQTPIQQSLARLSAL
jgi:hypothetical protein